VSNVAVVRRFLDLILEGKLEEALGCLHEDFVIRSPPELPYGGDHHGPAGFGELVAGLVAIAVPEQIGAPEIRDAGDCVVLRAPSRFTSHTTGESVEITVVELYFVRDGQIVEMDVYYKDPAAVARLA
jgi:ketosteroid isomerase-like protein